MGACACICLLFLAALAGVSHATPRPIATNFTLRVGFMSSWTTEATETRMQRDIIALALEEVRNRSTPAAQSMQTNFTVELRYRGRLGTDDDDVTSRRLTAREAYALHTQDNIDVLLGSGVSFESMVANLYLAIDGVPQISAFSTSPALSDDNEYGSFMRTCAPDDEQSLALARLVLHFGWDTVAVLSGMDDYSTALSQRFAAECAAHGINVLATYQFSYETAAVAVDAVAKIGARVIVLLSLEKDAAGALIAAHEAGITGPGYAWLGGDGVDIVLQADYPPSKRPSLLRAMQGLVVSNPFTGQGTPAYDAFVGRMAAQKRLNSNLHPTLNLTDMTLASSYAGLVYEAIYVCVLGADALLAAGMDPHVNRTEYLDAMQRTRFEGPTGTTVFRSNGDRVGSYEIHNFVGESFRLTVGSYANGTWSFTHDVQWADGTTMAPSDAVCVPGCVHGACVKGTAGRGSCACDFDWLGVRCSETFTSQASSRTAIAVAACVGSCAFVAIAGATVFVRRKRRSMARARRHVINYGELTILALIGSGGFGDVYKARFRGTIVAVKRIFPERLRPEHSRKPVPDVAPADHEAGERRLSAAGGAVSYALTAANALGGVKRTKGNSVFGNIRDALKNVSGASLTKRDERRMALFHAEIDTMCRSVHDILFVNRINIEWGLRLKMILDASRGMQYLHGGLGDGSVPFLHCDLKAANLFVDESWTLKVADFGLTHLGTFDSTRVGTLVWMPPETLKGESYTMASDCYSFGIVLWEFICADIPYLDYIIANSASLEWILSQVIHEDLRPAYDTALTPSRYARLMEACWSRDPTNRPSFAVISAVAEEMVEQHARGDIVFPANLGAPVPPLRERISRASKTDEQPLSSIS